MRKMSEEEIYAFLREGTRTGKLGVVREDGAPMVVPVWFGVDTDGSLVFTTYERTAKARAMRRQPRVSICVDREEPLYDYVRADGTAELLDDPELLAVWARRLAARYMGEERAEDYGRRNAVPGELLVRVRPTRLVGRAEVAG